MLDPKRLLDSFLGQQTSGSQGDTGAMLRNGASRATQMAKDNPLAAGALAAMLLGTGTGRKLTGKAVQVGGMAAIAGLAYKAWQDYQSGRQPGETSAQSTELLPPPVDTPFNPALAPQGEDEFALALLRAMIAAARADGHIDAAEREKIAGRLKESGADQDEAAFMMEELERPVDIDSLVAAAKTDAQKVELYAASRLTIEPRTRSERGYLDMLAGRLGLPDALIDHVEATVTENASV